jgi:hypothetical protein
MERRNGGAGDVAGAPVPEGEALDFVRFCHRRKHVGWPELYDEMCAVAGRALYRGYDADQLAEIGIGLGLFQMPALAGLVARVVAEETDQRRRLADAARTNVVLAARRRVGATEADDTETEVGAPAPAAERTAPEPSDRSAPDLGSIRLAVPAGA